MKRKSLLFLLLMAMFAPLAVLADELTVANGTGTHAEIPLYGLYADDNYQHTQTIYPATMLTDMQGTQITKLTYYLSSSVTQSFGSTFQVRFGTTTETEFSTGTVNYISVTSNPVYSSTLSVSGTTVVFDFSSNPYTYTGGNLVIDVRLSSLGSGYKSMSFYGESASTNYSVKNKSNSSLPTSTGTAVTFMPKTTFTYEAPASCPKPTNLTYTLVQGNGTVANLSWTAGGDETEWTVEYATNSAFTNPQTKPVSNTPSTQLTNLTPETPYYARVIAVCGANDESEPSASVTFTPTNAYSITVNEGTNTGSYVPFYGYYVDQTTRSQFIIPSTQLASLQWGTIDKLTFFSSTATASWGNAKFDVYMKEVDQTVFASTTQLDWSTMTKVVEGQSVSISNNQMEITLSTPFNYTGGHLLIGFYETTSGNDTRATWLGVTQSTNTSIYYYGNSGSTGYEKFLPKVTIDYTPGQAPSCLTPTGLDVVGSPTAHGVTVQWNAEAGETFDYAIELGTGIDPETVTYAGSITATTTTCSMSWNNLMNGDSDYTIFIRKNCGNGDYSAAATKVIHTAIACPAPTDLAISDLTATSGTLTWTDNAGADQWELCFDGDEENLQTTNHTPSYPLTGFTAETVHTVKVRAVCGGNDGKSDWSNTVSFEPTNKQLITGETTSTSGYLPSNTNYDYSYTQQIYTVAELGTAGLIESIDFYMTSTSNYTRNLDVYMVTTDKSSFDGQSDWITVTDDDKVFSGNVSFAAQAWTTITLSTPFVYDGTQNVAIIVDDNTNAWDSRYFSTYTASDSQSHYYYRDDNDIVPNNAGTNGTVTTAKNQIRILKSDLNGCVAPTGLTATVNGAHSITIGWNQYGEVPSWNIHYQIVGDPDSHQRTVYTNPYTFTDLQAETEYTFKVCANCDDTHYAWSSTSVNATTDIACPAPTNLTVNHITNNTAEISFDGATNYNVRYAPVVTTSYDFEDGTFSGWTYYDNDGDSKSWIVTDELGEYTSGDTYVASHGGAYYLRSTFNSDALTENWLISPQFKLGGSISFYIERLNGYDDYYKVYVSTSGTSISNFTEEVQGEREPATSYELVTIDLSNYSGDGYVAIKHYAKENDQAYLFIDDITIVEGIDINDWQYPNSLTLTGLSSETDYVVQVQADCGNTDGTSAWVSTTFTTLDDCAVPYDLTSDVVGTTATLNWTGAQDYYNVRYRKLTYGEAVTTTENFSDYTPLCYDGGTPVAGTSLPSDWEFQSDNANNYTPRISNNDDCSWTPSGMGSQGNYLYMTGGHNYAVMPHIVGITSFSFKYACEGSYGTLKVGYMTNGTFTAFTDITTSTTTTLTSINLTSADINTLNSTSGASVAFYWYCDSNWAVGIDDIVYTAQSVSTGAWENKINQPCPLEITGLETKADFEWQVQGINGSCAGDGEGNTGVTEWSAMANFSTPECYIKPITGYTANNNGWYLIATPLEGNNGETAASSVTNMIKTENNGNGYDLYRFDQNPAANDNDEVLEWRNFKANPFNLKSGEGYLYANSDDVDLIFTGAAYTGTGEVDLTYSEGNDLSGWNLVGNPFAEKAYIISGADSYLVLDNGTELATADRDDDYVDAMEGILVYTEADGTLQFSTTAPSKLSKKLALNVSRGRGVMDRAIVRFDNSNPLPKLQLRDNSTKIYFPINGKDYAVVNAQEQGEMPVNFKAEEEGTYTLSINTKEVEFAYLHLIDNKTGNDIDLLETPSYTFDAKTTDYKSRFTLVFVTGSSTGSDTFAFYSNGNWVINNEGNATLQVIDVNGRILSSESINGCANVNVNAAAGVYMLRLINGDNVKTQKVVVK